MASELLSPPERGKLAHHTMSRLAGGLVAANPDFAVLFDPLAPQIAAGGLRRVDATTAWVADLMGLDRNKTVVAPVGDREVYTVMFDRSPARDGGTANAILHVARHNRYLEADTRDVWLAQQRDHTRLRTAFKDGAEGPVDFSDGDITLRRGTSVLVGNVSAASETVNRTFRSIMGMPLKI